jgi:hypothetical protein
VPLGSRSPGPRQDQVGGASAWHKYPGQQIRFSDTASESRRRAVRREGEQPSYVPAMRIVAVAAALLMSLVLAPHASAASSSATAKNTNGQSLTVSQTRDLNPQGQRVTVTGRGFNPTVGIYVALCPVPKRGQRPGPCGGGVNLDGRDPASAWIASNPPPYGAAVAQPYDRNGRFRARLFVSPMIGDIDCRVTACAIVTRADHRRTQDRRFDVVVPVTFAQR